MDRVIERVRSQNGRDRTKFLYKRIHGSNEKVDYNSTTTIGKDVEIQNIVWVLQPTVQGHIKVASKMKYVLITSDLGKRLPTERQIVVFRPAAQRIYETRVFRTRSDFTWLQVIREHNLNTIPKTIKKQGISRGQPLIVEVVKKQSFSTATMPD